MARTREATQRDKLRIMAGAEAALYARIEPLLRYMGSGIKGTLATAPSAIGGVRLKEASAPLCLVGVAIARLVYEGVQFTEGGEASC